MFTGWLHHRHRVNRPLSEDEIESRLDPILRSPVLPDERVNLLRMNSVYAEFIDNRFFSRGLPTLAGAISVPVLIGMPLCITHSLLEKWWTVGATSADISFFLSLQAIGLFCAVLLWKLTGSKDICTYTYYPIRFNRKTQNIYVFRHNGQGGVLTVPWEKAFFFIGRGQGGEKHLHELRCHALDESGMIIDTFGVGHDDTSRGGILEVWEMIRLYMAEGPQAVPQYPVLSFPQRVTWKESWLAIAAPLGGASVACMVVTAPLWAVGTVTHYLTLKTCKLPVWPQEVDAACRFELDDPYLLPEERYEPSHPRHEEVWAAVAARRARNGEVLEAWERAQRSPR